MSSGRPLEVLQPVSHRVKSFDGEEIHYDLYPASSRTAVLIVPGFWRERRHPSIVRLAATLHHLGYTSAVCDLRGHGDSGGTFGFNRNEHHDVAAVVRDLVRTAPVESVTLVGFSYGGAIAVSTAARHPLPLASVVLISPVADYAMLAPRINPFTIHRHIAFRLAFRRPRFPWLISRAPKLPAIDDVHNVHVPLCLIHVKNDWLVDHSHSIALYDRANEPKELHVMEIEGNYHADRILSVAGNAIETIMVDFLERYSSR
ncbi:MAG: alpha/beta hydrolase family protein [Thermoanaerobaculia bacterium]